MLRAFPTLTDLEDYLQVVIGRPVIIPALSEQLNQQQAECLDQITKFIQQYDQNLEQRLRESALAGGEQLAVQLLEELADWEPGRKPVQFKKKMERHLLVRAKAAELQERFGECAIAESTNASVQTLRLTFAGHQEVKQFAR
nr:MULTISPECIES: hypothetical protein [Nostoc]